ncbi:MAG: hypothetical protein IJS61_03455 [Firmicutes bacterium]|nr:hypothetical protein [Bacillota bacterium]
MSTVTKPIILDSTGQAIAEGIQAIADSKAISNFDHNSLCRNGVELTDKYTIEQILSKVQSGDFSDIYVGDTITVSINTTLGGAEDVELLVAGINSYGGRMAIWDEESDDYDHDYRNHLALVPKDCLKTTAKMNATNTAEGGYYQSAMFKTTIPVYVSAFESVFGQNRLFAPEAFICQGTDFNKESIGNVGYYEDDYLWGSEEDWDEGTNPSKLQLLTEMEVYGQNIYNHSYDGCNHRGMRKQLPLFKLRPDYIPCGRGYKRSQSTQDWWWLQDVADSWGFSCVSGDGDCYGGGASNSRGVRPLLYIG